MSGESSGILGVLQRELEAMHDVDTELDVEAYSIGDDVRQSIPEAVDGLVEQLFVRDDGDTVELALYVAPHVLQHLAKDDPCAYLHPGNFEAFCIALEGVSHFVFLAWRAKLGRPVTALEMELQAEVDKFLLAWMLVLAGRAHPVITANALLDQLFDGYALRDDVPQEQHERYVVASRAAQNVCRGFVRRAGRVPSVPAIMRAARQYFRRGLPEKLQAA